jgi:hypothetical protein
MENRVNVQDECLEQDVSAIKNDVHTLAYPKQSIWSTLAVIGVIIGIAASGAGIWSLVLQLLQK